LDGDAPAGGGGRGYLYDAATDLPSGDGVAGGDAVFFVGSCIGDCSGDGKVNIFDAFAFNQAWGSSKGYPNYNVHADFSGDGSINIFDAFQLNSHWGHQMDALPSSLSGMSLGEMALLAPADEVPADGAAVTEKPVSGSEATAPLESTRQEDVSQAVVEQVEVTLPLEQPEEDVLTETSALVPMSAQKATAMDEASGVSQQVISTSDNLVMVEPVGTSEVEKTENTLCQVERGGATGAGPYLPAESGASEDSATANGKADGDSPGTRKPVVINKTPVVSSGSSVETPEQEPALPHAAVASYRRQARHMKQSSKDLVDLEVLLDLEVLVRL